MLREHKLVGDEIENIEPPTPLIDGVLDLDSTAMLYGPSGAGKSFVALDWALSVAAGRSWFDHSTSRGRVLYAVGEGLSGTAQRYSAWKAYHGVSSVAEIEWLPIAANMLIEPVFTLLDTMARHMPGGDENSFQTMSIMVDTLDQIRRLSHGGCALGVHHTGKDQTAGARGHSSLKGAMDTEILCTKGPTLAVTKQKNHEDGHLLGVFTLKPEGDSMVLEQGEGGDQNDQIALAALEHLGSAGFNEWRDAAIAMGVPRGSFARVRERLLKVGRVIPSTDTSTGRPSYSTDT
jgi:hypothetical protein